MFNYFHFASYFCDLVKPTNVFTLFTSCESDACIMFSFCLYLSYCVKMWLGDMENYHRGCFTDSTMCLKMFPRAHIWSPRKRRGHSQRHQPRAEQPAEKP